MLSKTAIRRDWPELKSYIAYLEDSPGISVYTITNGTIELLEEDLVFLEEHGVNVGFSIDGYKELHDRYRCNSFDRAMGMWSIIKRSRGIILPLMPQWAGKVC